MSVPLQSINILLFAYAACFHLATSAFLEYEESVNPPPLSAPLDQLLLTGQDMSGPTSRPTDYTHEERGELIGAHNNYRRQVSPTAANMNVLVWDSTLAAMAQGWSDECLFAHGNPENKSPFGSVGQNLFIRWSSKSSPPSPSPSTSVDVWHAEVEHYTYGADKACAMGEVCGHYTQVVWARTTHFGCGKAFCKNATDGRGRMFINAWIVTCNYGPAGNYNGQRPYIEGDRCIKCSGDPATCQGNLCKACDLAENSCSCDLVCENCGLKSTTNGTCECVCPDGFWGDNCEKPCEDTHDYCGANPGWPRRSCSQHQSIPAYCPLLCGVCAPPDPEFTCDEGLIQEL